MLKIIEYIKQSIEGHDGKPSSQKIVVYFMVFLFTFVVISVGVFNLYYPEIIYHIIAGVILGQSGIRAWQTTKNNEIQNKKDNEEN